CPDYFDTLIQSSTIINLYGQATCRNIKDNRGHVPTRLENRVKTVVIYGISVTSYVSIESDGRSPTERPTRNHDSSSKQIDILSCKVNRSPRPWYPVPPIDDGEAGCARESYRTSNVASTAITLHTIVTSGHTARRSLGQCD